MSEKSEKFSVHGIELFLIGIAAFILIIALCITTYKVFIVQKVEESEEYMTANYYVANSQTLTDELLSPIQSIKFDSVKVTEKDGYGLSEITYILHLQNDTIKKVQVGLVKISDFWIVYKAALDPDMPRKKNLVSSYQKVLYLLQRIDFKDYKTATAIMRQIKKEIRDPFLTTFLDARVNIIGKNFTRAEQQLKEVYERVSYARIAVLFEKGKLFYEKKDYKKAIQIFLQIEQQYELQYADLDYNLLKTIFIQVNKDPFVALLDPESVFASSRDMLASSYLAIEKYDQALIWSKKSIEQSKKIKSSVLKIRAMFLKAKSLYFLKKYKEALSEFNQVIKTKNSTDGIKAWSYFYKASISYILDKPEDAIDFYEIAITLAPTNIEIRTGAIEALIKRNEKKTLQIALFFAVRGIDYEVERKKFVQYKSQIENLLKKYPVSQAK